MARFITLLTMLFMFYEAYAEDLVYKTVPSSYDAECSEQGVLRSVSYSTPNAEGEIIGRQAYVYLPYGYDKTKMYDIIYLMHGMGDTLESMLGSPDGDNKARTIIDHMIKDKLMAPCIVVVPTFYIDGGGQGSNNSGNSSVDLTRSFQNELRNSLMPAVESRYSTYSAYQTTEEAFRNSREHRAFGGFSMGGATTWFCLCDNLDYFSKFFPMSGDCWVYGPFSGSSSGNQTADYLANAIKTQGYSSDDFFVFMMTGTGDYAMSALDALSAALQKNSMFSYGSDTEKNNLFYMVADGGVHNLFWMAIYLYNIYPVLFPTYDGQLPDNPNTPADSDDTGVGEFTGETEVYSIVDENFTLHTHWENCISMTQGEASVLEIQATPSVKLKAVSGGITGSTSPASYGNTWQLKNNLTSGLPSGQQPLYFIAGQGNPFVDFVDNNGKCTYTYFNPDQPSHPVNGVYYTLSPNIPGKMKVQIWNNKGNRKMFVLDTTSMALISPNDIKISGYVNDYKTGSVLTFHEDIPPLSGSEYIPQASVNSDKVLWGWAEFDVEEGHSYCLFNQNTQLGFGGFSFTPNKSTGISNVETSDGNASNDVYNTLGQKVTRNHKGLIIIPGKGKILNR